MRLQIDELDDLQYEIADLNHRLFLAQQDKDFNEADKLSELISRAEERESQIFKDRKNLWTI